MGLMQPSEYWLFTARLFEILKFQLSLDVYNFQPSENDIYLVCSIKEEFNYDNLILINWSGIFSFYWEGIKFVHFSTF